MLIACQIILSSIFLKNPSIIPEAEVKSLIILNWHYQPLVLNLITATAIVCLPLCLYTLVEEAETENVSTKCQLDLS